MGTSPETGRQILGMLNVAAGVSVFSLQDAIIKSISGNFPVHEIVFVRSVVALPILLLITIVEVRGTPVFGRLGLHLLRGLLMYFAFTCYYLGLARLQIAETVALFFVAPLFVVALSGPVLGERVQGRSWIAIVVGGAGVLTIVRPGFGQLDLVLFLPVVAALAYAASVLCGRTLGASESGGAMALSANFTYIMASAATGLVLTSMDTPLDGNASLRFLLDPWLWPDARHLGLIATCGLISAVAFFCLGQGYRLAEASRAASFEYASLPWGILWGYLFFGSLPDLPTMLGALMIIGGGFYALHLERGLRRARCPSRSSLMRMSSKAAAREETR